MSQLLQYLLRKDAEILSQLYAQSSVVDQMIQPILQGLEGNRDNRHVIQEENERLITVTRQLHQQIPCIVRDAIQCDSTLTKVLLFYMSTNYVIHIKWMNLPRK